MAREDDFILLRALLQRVIQAEGFTTDNPKISIKPGSEAGDGFLGTNSAIEIEDKNKVLKLFAKAATKDEKVRGQVSLGDVFGREIFFYETLRPEFLKFQSKRNVKRPFDFTPKCYLTSTENLNEVLILENLKEQGYVLYDKKLEDNEQHIEFIFKLYARFHAISYAMKDQEPQLYTELSDGLHDLIATFFKTAGVGVAFTHYCEEVKKFFSSDEDAWIMRRIENLTEMLMETLPSVDNFVDDYSVITHGDCWCNNFLFKYTDSNDLQDIKVIDWQMLRVNSPVLDLSYFFYGVASKSSMDNLDYYLQIYYDTLSENISEMGSDPDKVYPYQVFREHWRKFSRYGLMMSLGILKVMSMGKEDAPNPVEAIEAGKNFGDAFVHIVCDDEVYRQKIRNVVEHFVRNNFI